VITRSNKKPPAGYRCDASCGVDYNRRTPRIRSCPNEATVELLGAAPVGETWVCEACAEAILARKKETAS
jgi:hypothetical protein